MREYPFAADTEHPSNRIEHEQFIVPEFNYRNELGSYLNQMGLTGEGVELGCYQCSFSEQILKHWDGKKLHLIDIAFDQIKDLPRTLVYEEPGHTAVNRFDDASLDFVYIDAAHDYKSVCQDLEDWYAKVKPLGLLCGHDYYNSNSPDIIGEHPVHIEEWVSDCDDLSFGIKCAVWRFADKRGLKIYTTADDEKGSPSWFIIKPMRFVTTLTNSFTPGFMALIQSMKENAQIPFVFTCVEYEHITDENRELLESLGVHIDWYPKEMLGKFEFDRSLTDSERMAVNIDKPLIWRLPYTEQCVYTDTDVLCLNSLKGIERFNTMSVVIQGTAIDAGPDDDDRYRPSGMHPFNAGFFVYTPSEQLFQEMQEYAKTYTEAIHFGDQVPLNDFFASQHPEMINYVNINWNLCHWVVPRHPDICKMEHVRLLHFAGPKPWMHRDEFKPWMKEAWDMWQGYYNRAMNIKPYRFVTALTKNYVQGMVALLQSMKENANIDYCFTVIEYEPMEGDDYVPDDAKEFLGKMADIEWIRHSDLGHFEFDRSLTESPRMIPNFNKFLIWLLPYDEYCCYIDTDMLVLNSLAGIEEIQEFSACVKQSAIARQPADMTEYQSDMTHPFNAGLMIFKPDKDLFDDIQVFASEYDEPIKYGDQIIHNDYFAKYKGVNFLEMNWNVSTWVKQKYPHLYDESLIRILHYAHPEKPWCDEPQYKWQQEQWKTWWSYYNRAIGNVPKEKLPVTVDVDTSKERVFEFMQQQKGVSFSDPKGCWNWLTSEGRTVEPIERFGRVVGVNILNKSGEIVNKYGSDIGNGVTLKSVPPKRKNGTPCKSCKIKLTVGMPTYDDHHGVKFTVQALRWMHSMNGVEILVVDNNPDSNDGKQNKKLINKIPNATYIEYRGEPCASRSKDIVFRKAKGEVVLCVDCHVLIKPGAIDALMRWFDAHPGSVDMVQGPIAFDNLINKATHFEDEWRGDMWGTWKLDKQIIEGNPFEIKMQGCGLMAMRKEAWVGSCRRMVYWGGETGYLQQMVRNNGGKVWCLPELEWWHRFDEAGSKPFPHGLRAHVWNYYVGHLEAGLDIEKIREHFKGRLPDQEIDIIEEVAISGGNYKDTLEGKVPARQSAVSR